MGEYFIVVNVAKRQFLNPSRFGECMKRSSLLRGFAGVAFAHLLMGEGNPPDVEGRLAPSWAGDPLFVAGDEQGPMSLDFAARYGLPPGESLYGAARSSFQDISHHAIAMLCAVLDAAPDFAERATRDESLLVELGDVALGLRCGRLRHALGEVFGADWEKAYRKAAAARHVERLPHSPR